MQKKYKKLHTELQEIEKDCLELKRKGDLTEYGRGELHVINLTKKLHKTITKEVWNILNTFRMKYFLAETRAEISIGDFECMMDNVKKIVA